LCAIKVLNNNGYGTNAEVIQGIDYVATMCSSTPGMNCVATLLSLGSRRSSLLNHAVAAAVDSDVVMVVAAGNDNQNACWYSPASEPKALTVGSTDKDDKASSFSNWGSCVNVYAPGQDITTSFIGGNTATITTSGTGVAASRKFISLLHVEMMMKCDAHWTPILIHCSNLLLMPTQHRCCRHCRSNSFRKSILDLYSRHECHC
jgi:subtilisin family serine protease